MTQALTIKDDMSLMELGNVLSRSGYFSDVRDVAQAIVKVLAGREMGFGPIASMTGIYIVKGKPSMGANLIAAAVKRSGKYDYRVRTHTADECSIEFYERIDGKRELIGVSTFTKADAIKAGTQNLDKFPRNMFFARAMSNGAKWYCADVFGGPIYTPEELGATVDDDGEVIGGPKWETVTSYIAPIAQTGTDARDAALEAQIMSDVPAPTAAPEPTQPRQSYRMAHVKFNGMTADKWHEMCAGFAEQHPNWQKDGKPDMNHILASAGHAGYEYITGENVASMFVEIVNAHNEKAQA